VSPYEFTNVLVALDGSDGSHRALDCALSLAAALSIPATVVHRDEILFLTFTTIVGGLLLLAVPFPWLLDRLAGADQRHAG